MASRIAAAALTQSARPRWWAGAIIFFAVGCLTTFAASGRSMSPQSYEPPTALIDVLQQNKLIVLTRRAPTTYFDSLDGPTGFEHDLALSFGEYLGVDVEFKFIANRANADDPLFTQDVHVIAAGFSDVQLSQHDFHAGPAYKPSQPLVVCHRSGFIPRNAEQLHDAELTLIENHHLNLHGVVARKMTIAHNQSIEEIFAYLSQQKAGCTIANSDVFLINRHYYPHLKAAFPLKEHGNLTWRFNDNGRGLANAAHHWFEQLKNSGEFDAIHDKHFKHAHRFDYVENSRLHRRIQSRLPKYIDLFRQAEEQYGIPWPTLAAMSYQESHWNPRAISPTGVRGMMMLTLKTARSMGIRNRIDAESSIMGGAKYLSWLIERVPEGVPAEQRMWFAIAAYNVGYGHLQDARTLTREMGKDPNNWEDVRECLPLLTQEEYYANLRYGYARGHEPVVYVDRIRYYERILSKHARS